MPHPEETDSDLVHPVQQNHQIDLTDSDLDSEIEIQSDLDVLIESDIDSSDDEFDEFQSGPTVNKNFTNSIDLKISSTTDSLQHFKIKEFFTKNKFSSVQSINEKNTVNESGVNEFVVFIKFNDKLQAEQAYIKLKPILKNSSLEFNYNSISHPGNIYIRGLSKTTTQEELAEYFGKFGELLSSKILIKKRVDKNDKENEEIYGFLNFKNHLDATNVIKNCNGLKIFSNNELYLNNYISKKERFLKLNNLNFPSNIGVSHNYKILFLENIPIEYDVDEIISKFEEFGEIDALFFPKVDEESQNLKGYGFIKFHKNKSALESIISLNNIKLNNSFLKISIVQQKHNYYLSINLTPNNEIFKKLINNNDFQETNLYIKNLPNAIDTDQKLSKIFKDFGNIISSKIITNNEGQTKNYGFVCYEKISMAITAILKLNGKLINGKKISIFFAEKNYNNNKTFKKLNGQNHNSSSQGNNSNNYNNMNNNMNYQYYYYNQGPSKKYQNQNFYYPNSFPFNYGPVPVPVPVPVQVNQQRAAAAQAQQQYYDNYYYYNQNNYQNYEYYRNDDKNDNKNDKNSNDEEFNSNFERIEL